jgi:hypothetical protein
MKTFRDSSGGKWTVFEVRRHINPKLPAGQPHRYGDGWLCFESGTVKKRLVSYPNGWREFDDAELEKLLAKAQRAPRAILRLDDDLGDATPIPDARAD